MDGNMIRSILRCLERLEEKYPKPTVGEMVNKKLATRLRSLGLKHLLKDLPSAEMDDEQMAAFERSHTPDFLRAGVLPEGFLTEAEMKM
jgi:hypothetical protein